jgi:hypothetical protein
MAGLTISGAGSDARPATLHASLEAPNSSTVGSRVPAGRFHCFLDNRAGFHIRLARRDVAFHADLDDPFAGLGKLGIGAVGCGHRDFIPPVAVGRQSAMTTGKDYRRSSQPTPNSLTISFRLAAMPDCSCSSPAARSNIIPVGDSQHRRDVRCVDLIGLNQRPVRRRPVRPGPCRRTAGIPQVAHKSPQLWMADWRRGAAGILA